MNRDFYGIQVQSHLLAINAAKVDRNYKYYNVKYWALKLETVELDAVNANVS